jgi:hypothetical protein
VRQSCQFFENLVSGRHKTVFLQSMYLLSLSLSYYTPLS